MQHIVLSKLLRYSLSSGPVEMSDKKGVRIY